MAKLASSCTHKLFYEGGVPTVQNGHKVETGKKVVPRRAALHRRSAESASAEQHRLLAPPGSRSGGADGIFVSTGGLIGGERLICARDFAAANTHACSSGARRRSHNCDGSQQQQHTHTHAQRLAREA